MRVNAQSWTEKLWARGFKPRAKIKQEFPELCTGLKPRAHRAPDPLPPRRNPCFLRGCPTVEHATTKRWQEAQEAELDWWQNWRKLPFYKNHSFASYWGNVISEVMSEADVAKARTIVEVGCGPHGVVRYMFKDAQVKLGTDPLLCQYDERPKPVGNTFYAAAVGESIPVKDGVADLVICINVIDHVMDADQILMEMRRVLKPGGQLLLEVHTFPAIFTPFMFFDHPHTYHWTLRTVIELVRKTGFSIERTRQLQFPIRLPWTSLFVPSHWKYIFGKLFMRLTYVNCRLP